VRDRNAFDRVHREQDPRVRRLVQQALAGGSALMLVGLVVTALRVQQVHLAYELDGIRAERSRIETIIQQLEVEVATLRSPGRIEARARQLGLVSPGPDQVRVAREYVSGGEGAARADGRRVAAAIPLAPDDPRLAAQP
jgi:cell division protein FtsL